MRRLSPSVFRERYSTLIPLVNIIHDTNCTTPNFVTLTDGQDDNMLEDSNSINLSHDNEILKYLIEIDNNIKNIQ